MWYTIGGTKEWSIPLRLDLLPPESRALVEQGVYNAYENGDERPLLYWAEGPNKDRLAPGSGKPVNSPDAGVISKRFAWKRTNAYRELLREVIKPNADPKDWGSFGWLITQGLIAAEGGDTVLEITCPHCHEQFSHKAWKRPDSNAIVKLAEQVLGRATETKDVNIEVRALYEMLDERTRTGNVIEIYDITDEEVEEKRLLVEGNAA